jgi:yeast amino acid transporter
VLIFSVFSLSGLEILSLAAVETINPVKAFPSSVRTTFWVTLPLSITSIIAVGFLVPFTDIRLLRVPAHYDVNASPFVIAFNDAGVTGLGNLLNVVVLVTTFSTAMSSIYVSSRNFVALAKQNHAPRIFAYIDQKGRPTIGLLLSLCTGLFAFTGSARGADIAFAWLISVSGISSIFVWGSICLSHIRFRRGWEKQGHALTELPYRSPFGKLGSWYGLSFNVAVLLSQLWTCTGPNTYTDSASIELIGSFLAAYIYAPIILVLYTGYKIWHRTSLVRSNSMFFRSSINGSADGTQAGTVMLDSLPS